MSQLSDEYYTNQELKNIVIQNSIADGYLEDFVKKVEQEIEIMTNDGELTRFEIRRAAIDFSLEFITKLDAEIRKGHGRRWAELYADNHEQPFHAFDETYLTLKSENSSLALAELKIHCKFMGADDLYEKHFIYLMDNGEGTLKPDKQAKIYSQIYKEQISLGRTEVFCHRYADLMADDEYTESYCFTFARCFDEATSEGRSERYSYAYAFKMAEYYGDQYSLSSKIKYDQADMIHEAEIKKAISTIR